MTLKISDFQGLADAFPVPIMIISDEGKIHEVIGSPNIDSVIDIHQFSGKTLADIWSDDRVEGFETMIKAVIDEETVQSLEYWMEVDGFNRCFEAHVSPLKQQFNGEACVLWVAFDVTERKRMESALQRRDQLLDGVAQAKTVLLSVSSMDDAMPRALATMGHAANVECAMLAEWEDSSNDFKKRYEWYLHDDNPEAQTASIISMSHFLPEWNERLQHNGVVRLRAQNAKGSKRQYLESHGIRSMILLPVWVKMEFWGFMGLYDMSGDRDWEYSEVATLRVTAGSIGAYIINKQAEDLLKEAKNAADAANAAKGEFLAMMSHEIRTPMNSILGFADLLQKGSLNEDEKEYADIIIKSGKNLLELINNILDYSKIESRGIELDSEPFSLETTIMEALQLLTVKAYEKKIKLDMEIGGDAPETFVGDSLRLRQVLINLVSNSIKFTEEGHVKVKAECIPRDNRFEIHFVVEDTGVGIPIDKIDKLFQPFSQVDHSKSRRYGGTGLGLVICKRLVNKMGGDIRVESREGEGARFYFNIFLDAVREGASRRELHREALIYGDFNEKYPLNITLIRSVGSVSKLENQLPRYGFHPSVVSDEDSAKTALRNESGSVIILDGAMAEVLHEVIAFCRAENLKVWVISCSDRIYAQGNSKAEYIDEALPHEVEGHELRRALARAHKALSGKP